MPFALPDIGEDEINEVVHSLRSGWLTTGIKARQFEKEFAEFIGPDVEAVAVNSATAGLHLALEAVGISQGDEVITTPYTFTATAEVIRYFGAHPVFVDIDPNTYNLDPDKLELAITPKTKAIIPVHFGGYSCEMDKIMEIARAYNLRIIEDAAHALPTHYKGKLVGSLDTDAAVFSFYATKTITTGEGGMIVTKDRNIAARCRTMRLHGINRDVFDRYTSSRPAWYYEVVAPGYKYNLTDIAASIGIHQLRKCMSFYEKRKDIARIYNEEFKNLPLILPPQPDDPDSTHSWHLYVVGMDQASTSMSRNDFVQKLFDMGIGCSVHFIPLHLHPYWSSMYNYKPEDFPVALSVYERSVSLPIYTKMSDSDIARVVDAVKAAFR